MPISEIDDPTMDDLDKAFSSLDGKGVTTLIIETVPDEMPYLSIVGPIEDGYVVTVKESLGEEHAALANKSSDRQEVGINIEGQWTPFPRKWLLRNVMAKAAAAFFLKNGKRSPEIEWEPV